MSLRVPQSLRSLCERATRTLHLRVELLLAIVGMILLIGLIAWQLHRLRMAANRAQSLNNLREMALACHGCNDVYRQLPPGVGSFPQPGASTGTVFFFILPFTKQPPNNGAAETIVQTFLAPDDPSVPTNTLLQNHAGLAMAGISYAANGYVFAGDANINSFNLLGDPPPGCENLPAAIIPRTFGDGIGNTILFMEKHATCAGVDPGHLRPKYEQSTAGQHTWANDTLLGLKQPMNTNGYNSNWVPVQISLRLPEHQPAAADCMLPQAFSAGGICVVMADGSTRQIQPNVSDLVWMSLLLPNDGITRTDN